ncbi:hypothetical protein F5X96DRAFT_670942 [Biscogniauxia mediterranea]|nr:hypothetical protein F5X96DRAFT_670942 [Biscogniauxia mediterranea]
MSFIAFLCAALYSSVALSQLQHQALRTQVLSTLGGQALQQSRRENLPPRRRHAVYVSQVRGDPWWLLDQPAKAAREIYDSSVFLAINARDLNAYDKDRSTPMMRDAPGEHGSTRYVDKRDSPKGEVYDMLKRVGDQIEH